ncbi:MAG: cation-translocating P-type ATPase [Pseudomonadota bacterium]
MFSPFATSLDAVFDELRSSRTGLSEKEVEERLEKHGENTLPESRPPGVFHIFLRQFKSPLIYVLLIAAAISFWQQHMTDAWFILAVLLFNAIVGAIQEYSASRSAEALQEMFTPHAVVIRDGKETEIEAKDLVPGDVVLLESGRRVPADVRLIESEELAIDESMLTGESEAVEKDAAADIPGDAPLSEQKNMAFSGAIVTNGWARAVVVSTGEETAMGDIAESVLGSEETKPPLVVRMERFTYILVGVVLCSVLILGVIAYFQGKSWEEILLTSIGLAVATMPEGLPVAVTVALAIGMKRMAERQVIVRKLVAVEALGSCTMIAADKTGTLTRNELTAQRIILLPERDFTITSGDTMVDGDIQETPEEERLLSITSDGNQKEQTMQNIKDRGEQTQTRSENKDNNTKEAVRKALKEVVREVITEELQDNLPVESGSSDKAGVRREEGLTDNQQTQKNRRDTPPGKQGEDEPEQEEAAQENQNSRKSARGRKRK